MGLRPTQAHRIGLAVHCLSQLATLSDHRSIIGKSIRTNKTLKQSCFASNRIVLLLKKNVSNQANAGSKMDLTSMYKDVMTK